MNARKTILPATLLMLFCVSAIQASAHQTATSQLKPRVIVFDGQLFALLAGIADSSKVNIGFEVGSGRPATKINLRCDTLDDCLDGIIAANPLYQWRKLDGFIDIYPRARVCPLLETTISEFQSDNNDWLSVTEGLTTLPEVAAQMNALNLTRSDLKRGGDSRSGMNLFSVKLKNMTLRRALHEITKSNNGTFWMFERYGKEERLFSLNTAY